MFQLSGGTTGIPKLIPRTHNDYICNSKLASAVTEVGPDKVLLDILPIEHNLALACPGMQGFLLHGGTVVLDTSVRGETIFPLVEKHGVTHIHVVPALLIRWINDPAIADHDLSTLRIHPERRPAAPARGAQADQGADPLGLRPGEFRHVRGHADVREEG